MAKDTGKKLIDMMYGQNPDQAAFGVYPQLKPKRTAQDPQAAKNVPVDLLRGAVSGVLGAPGDIESLIRLLPGLDENTILPTSEDIEKRLPFKSDTPVSRAATGLGQIGGGFYTGPGSPLRLAGALPGAVKRAGQDFAMAAAGSASHVIKPKGGNWIGGSVEDVLKPLQRGQTTPEQIADVEAHLEKIRPTYDLSDPRQARELAEMENHVKTLKSNLALNNWAGGNLTNYVKKEMATPDDPVRKLAEQGIVHIPSEQVGLNRYKANTHRATYGAERLGESEAARAWEDATDVAIEPMYIKNLHPDYREPWMEKADPKTQIFTPTNDMHAHYLGFDHILDVLREDLASGRIRPEQLNKVSMEQAVRRTYEYDQELAAKMAQARSAQRAELPVYKEYPEGYRWIELNKPGAFASESEAMGHSVRGYEPPQGHPDWIEGSGDRGSLGYGHGGWEGIKSGKAKVYSLVDPKGNPHVTVEVGGNNHLDFNKWWDSQPKELRDEINARARRGEHNMSVFEAPEYLAARDALPPRITQIKGKQNLAPGDEYLPFVQDFVKSGQWSDVGDLQNTGLIRRGNVFTPTEKQGLIDLGQDVPEYLTQEDIARLRRARGDLPPEDGMAHGGRVHISEDPDVMQMELAGGGLVKGLVKAAQAAKEAPSIIIPSKIQNVREAVRSREGNYAAKRVERAADEVRNLEKMFTEEALKRAFTGDNAKAVVTMSPADFEKYAQALKGRTQADIGPEMAKLAKQGEIDKYTVPTDEYIQHLLRVHGGFDQVPYLNLFKDEVGIPSMPEVRGHEGRHRSRALSEAGEPSTLVEISPRGDLREGLPRRSQEEYIEALREELERSGRMVLPEADGSFRRPAIELPEPYAEGGEVHMAGGGALSKLAKLARAPAKTKQEIQAIAERIAPQVTGEYVRAKPGSAATVTGKTQRQFEREKDLPVDIRPTGALKTPEKIDLESLKGNVLMGIPGDYTVTGKTLHGVGDVRLGSPSPQHGGPLYGLYHDDAHFWASEKGAASKVQNLAKEIAEQYESPVIGNYIMMGPEGMNYAQHFADANLQAIDLSKMSKRDIETLNKEIRKGGAKSGPRPSFPGVEDKESAYLHLAMDPALRIHFNETMQKEKFAKMAGLPSGYDIRYAVTEPELRDLETGVTGFSLGRMRPDIPSEELRLSEHPTYSHDIPGHFMGQTNYPIPYELSFPDTLKAVRENPKQAPYEFGSLKMVGPRQIIDQQLIDELRMYEERMKALTGKAAGGAVEDLSPSDLLYLQSQPDIGKLSPQEQREYVTNIKPDELRQRMQGKYAGGGEITADDLILEERKL